MLQDMANDRGKKIQFISVLKKQHVRGVSGLVAH